MIAYCPSCGIKCTVTGRCEKCLTNSHHVKSACVMCGRKIQKSIRRYNLRGNYCAHCNKEIEDGLACEQSINITFVACIFA
jgi:hypothetical protein